MLRFWPMWERLARRLHPTVLSAGSPYRALEVTLTRFRGQPFRLPDGTSIQPGDALVEFHFNNRRVLEATGGNPWQVLHVMERELQALAAWSDGRRVLSSVRAYYGVTMLASGTRRLGFVLRDRPNTMRYRLDDVFMSGLLMLYSPEGRGRLARGHLARRRAQEVWMSRAYFLERYGRNRFPNRA